VQQIASRAKPARAGGIDWPAYWRATVEAREGERTLAPAAAGGSRWDGRAERFAFLTRTLDAATDPFVLDLKARLRPGETLLDVGAGAGRYTMAFASAVRQVTAVEPSAGMRAQLERASGERGVRNLSIVAGSWEGVEVEPHDVALVANVLYFVPDAVRFIEKLDRGARRACYILHRIEERATPLLPIWDKVWGQPRPPEAGALDLLNVLYSMGIRASFQPVPLPEPARYATVDEALPDARQFLELSPDDETHDATLRAFLPSILTERGGQLEYPAGPQMAMIWWEKA
jgi:SAM-dependent methyltransferase